MNKPYIDKDDNLIIPLNSDAKYQYWNQEHPKDLEILKQILSELKRPDLLQRYLLQPHKGG